MVVTEQYVNGGRRALLCRVMEISQQHLSRVRRDPAEVIFLLAISVSRGCIERHYAPLVAFDDRVVLAEEAPCMVSTVVWKGWLQSSQHFLRRIASCHCLRARLQNMV